MVRERERGVQWDGHGPDCRCRLQRVPRSVSSHPVSGAGGTLRLCSAVLTVVLLEEFGSLTDWASAGLEVVRCCSRAVAVVSSRSRVQELLAFFLALACLWLWLADVAVWTTTTTAATMTMRASRLFEFAVGDAGWLCFPCPVLFHVPCPCPCPCPCFRSALVPSLSSRFGEHGW